VVVVGASLAGLSTVEGLRKKGFSGPIMLIGDEDALPYDRPPLSKHLLSGEWEPAQTVLRSEEVLSALDVEIHLCVRAFGVDTAAKKVLLAGGSRIPYDALVVATGATARPFPGGHGLAGVHTLRTLADSLAIRDALDGKPRVAIVGGGFVGAEVAAEARRRGLEVTLIEAAAAPLSGVSARAWERCAAGCTSATGCPSDVECR
jgi:3-phenylpropionate/trans-cinnamate dioxygenase ferredoxin reductase subunit